MAELALRDATGDDATAICSIYNQGIQDRVATLETEERTTEERRAWLAARGPRHPVVVAAADGAVIGWASLNVFNPRRAYDHVADFSVYVERELVVVPHGYRRGIIDGHAVVYNDRGFILDVAVLF